MFWLFWWWCHPEMNGLELYLQPSLDHLFEQDPVLLGEMVGVPHSWQAWEGEDSLTVYTVDGGGDWGIAWHWRQCHGKSEIYFLISDHRLLIIRAVSYYNYYSQILNGNIMKEKIT